MRKHQSAEERMKILLEKQKDIAAELGDLRRSVAQAERKRDAKRKILAGSCILHLVETGKFPDATWRTHLASFLTRPADRELFDLTSVSPTSKES